MFIFVAMTSANGPNNSKW